MIYITCLGLIGFKSFYTKNPEKSRKNMNIQEYLEKFQHFSTLLNVCFHVNKSDVKYLSTEKKLKNPRNSAYLYALG